MMPPVIGTIERVEANGSGRNSGEILIRLVSNQTHQSFWVFMDKPRDEFFRLLQAAFEAMWDGNTVRITSAPKAGGDNEVTAIATYPLIGERHMRQIRVSAAQYRFWHTILANRGTIRGNHQKTWLNRLAATRVSHCCDWSDDFVGFVEQSSHGLSHASNSKAIK
jgi:hypothetical protein